MKKNLRTASICVQGGYEPKNGEPIEVPIYQSTTFKYDNSEEMAMLFDLKKEGYFYTRLQNPKKQWKVQFQMLWMQKKHGLKLH